MPKCTSTVIKHTASTAYNITEISQSIDNLLSHPWDNQECKFYQMLVEKVALNKQKYVNFITYRNDSSELYDSIVAQKWYSKSQHKKQIESMIVSVTVNSLVETGKTSRGSSYKYHLDLNLKTCANHRRTDNKWVRLVVKYNQETDVFVIYISRSTDTGSKDTCAYIANANDYEIKLPDYGNLAHYIPLPKHEIICLITEIVIYYDVHQVIRHLPIGQQYPVSLAQLLNKIETKV